MKIGEILLSEKKITREQVNDALALQEISDKRLGEILLEKGYINSADLARALSVQTGFTLIEKIDASMLLNKLNRDIGFRFLYSEPCVFIKKDEKFFIACTSLSSGISEKLTLDSRIKGFSVAISPKEEIYAAVLNIFMPDDPGGTVASDPRILIGEALEIAISRKSPNVRIKKSEDTYLVNIDTHSGIDTIRVLPKELGIKVINILANLCQITLKQGENADAKFIFESKLSRRKINLRAEFLPVSSKLDKGGNILHEAVLRMHGLDRVIDLDRLGFDSDMVKILKGAYTYPHGFVIATGPTGSGKTTTFYGLLRLLAQKRFAIITIEDPVEIELKEPNITQMSTGPGFGFEKALATMLRSEPKIIMVGEIRENETAKTALRAAQTGHLVLTTLHSNSCTGVFNMLSGLGADAGMFMEAVRMVTGQRLYFPLCSSCRREIGINEIPVYQREPLLESLPRPLKMVFARGTDLCNECSGTGYKPRKSIIEIAVFTEVVKRELKLGNIGDEEFVKSVLKKHGFKSIKEQAAGLLERGEIDVLQYFQVTG